MLPGWQLQITDCRGNITFAFGLNLHISRPLHILNQRQIRYLRALNSIQIIPAAGRRRNNQDILTQILKSMTSIRYGWSYIPTRLRQNLRSYRFNERTPQVGKVPWYQQNVTNWAESIGDLTLRHDVIIVM